MKILTKFETSHSEFNAVVCSNYKNGTIKIINWIVDYNKLIKLYSDVGVWKIKKLNNYN